MKVLKGTLMTKSLSSLDQLAEPVGIYEKTIRETHLDIFSHVNNSVYMKIFEEARWEMIHSRGFGVDYIRENNIGPVILEANLRFIQEVRCRETVLVETYLEGYRQKIGYFLQVMKKKENPEKVVCEGRFKFGLWDLTQRKLIVPTSDWLFAVRGNELTVDK